MLNFQQLASKDNVAFYGILREEIEGLEYKSEAQLEFALFLGGHRFGKLFIETMPQTLTLSEKEAPKTEAERDRARARLCRNELGK